MILFIPGEITLKLIKGQVCEETDAASVVEYNRVIQR